MKRVFNDLNFKNYREAELNNLVRWEKGRVKNGEGGK